MNRRTRLNYAGVFVLFLGLGIGAGLYQRTLGTEAPMTDDEYLMAQGNTRAYEQAVQRNVGPVGLLFSRWYDALGKLGQPRAVAVEIALASALAAGWCFRAARRV